MIPGEHMCGSNGYADQLRPIILIQFAGIRITSEGTCTDQKDCTDPFRRSMYRQSYYYGWCLKARAVVFCLVERGLSMKAHASSSSGWGR